MKKSALCLPRLSFDDGGAVCGAHTGRTSGESSLTLVVLQAMPIPMAVPARRTMMRVFTIYGLGSLNSVKCQNVKDKQYPSSIL